MHGSPFKSRNFFWKHFVWLLAKDSLKLNNTINRLNIVLYYFISSNTCEYLMLDISIKL